MEQDISFTYNYSAKENREAAAIRAKYLPKEESKLDELKRLDRQVQDAGVMESLIVGILSSLVFGVGMCMGMDILAGGMIAGVLVGIVGLAGMLAAYPVFRRLHESARAKRSPRILELAAELTGE